MQPLTDEFEIAEAFAALEHQVNDGGERIECRVGYQGGSEPATLVWHTDEQLWALLEPHRIPTRYWCAFGLDNPLNNTLVSITCEINSPRAGINRRCAGLFLRDTNRAIYLAHSGKIGGGRKGIGKQAFLRMYTSRTDIHLVFPDGQAATYILIGRIDDHQFLPHLTAFVQAVAQFKHSTTIQNNMPL